MHLVSVSAQKAAKIRNFTLKVAAELNVSPSLSYCVVAVIAQCEILLRNFLLPFLAFAHRIALQQTRSYNRWRGMQQCAYYFSFLPRAFSTATDYHLLFFFFFFFFFFCDTSNNSTILRSAHITLARQQHGTFFLFLVYNRTKLWGRLHSYAISTAVRNIFKRKGRRALFRFSFFCCCCSKRWRI